MEISLLIQYCTVQDGQFDVLNQNIKSAISATSLEN